MTDIDRIEQMRLRPGDTIEMRQQSPRGRWVEYRRTLLWHGERVAVWACSNRNDRRPEWSEPIETADTVGAYSGWRKVDQ